MHWTTQPWRLALFEAPGHSPQRPSSMALCSGETQLTVGLQCTGPLSHGGWPCMVHQTLGSGDTHLTVQCTGPLSHGGWPCMVHQTLCSGETQLTVGLQCTGPLSHGGWPCTKHLATLHKGLPLRDCAGKELFNYSQ